MCTNCKNCNGMWCGCSASKLMKVLVVVGALNWGLVGIGMLTGSPLNAVNILLGSAPYAEAAVYLVVGISALGTMWGCRCKTCMSSCASCSVEAKTENKPM